MPNGIDAGTVNSQVRVNTGALRGDLMTAGKFFRTFAGGAIASLGAIGIAVVALTKTIQGIKAAVSTFAQFEQSMANVASVAKASTQEMEALNAAAQEAGRTTRFTASEAADALYYLASAGFDATQSMAALNGVLYLAGATQSDLATTSASVAASISQFNLDASEAERVANVFTAAITNSQATMDKLTTSMRYAGPVASGLGFSLEETVGALQILYNNGFAATQAGTALRGAFGDLANATSPAIAKLNELGITFEDINPATHSLAEVFGILGEAGLETGEIMSIFGNRAGPAMIKLIQGGQEAIEEYTEAVTGTNAAAEAYAIQNDTLAGAQDRFKSATESLAIAVGEQLAPFLRDVLEVGIALVNWLTEMVPRISEFLNILVFPTKAVASFAAELVDGRSASEEYAREIDRLGSTLEGVDRTIENAVGIHNQRVELDSLVTEYETLTSQTSLNADEQERLKIVIDELARRVPDAASAFDEFGNAIEINTEIARGASEDLLELERLNTEAALGTLRVEQQIAEQRAASLQYSRESARQQTEELQRQELELRGRVGTARSIMNEYFTAREAAGDDLAALQAAQATAADELFRAGFITAEQQTAVLNNQIGIVQLLNTTIAPLEEQYNTLVENLDEQFLEWKKIEEQTQRSDALLLEIAKKEQRLVEITNTLGLIDKQRLDDAQHGEEDLQETRDENADSEIENIQRVEAEKRRADEAFLSRLKKNTEEEIRSRQEVFEAWNAAHEKEIEATEGTYETLTDLSSDFFDALADMYELDTEKQLAALETTTNAKLEDLEKRKNAELEAAGLMEQTEIERLQAELAEAKKTGDKENIQKAQDALQSAEIDQKYAEEEARIQEESTRKEADIRYKGDLSAWKLRLAEAIYTAPMMAMNAYNSASAIPYVGWILAPGAAAAALAIGLLNIRNVRKGKPEKPSFATGGMVLAGNSGGTDVTVAENGSNELLFNGGASGRPFLREFAVVVADEILRRGFPIRIVNQLDGKVIADNTARYVKNGEVVFELR